MAGGVPARRVADCECRKNEFVCLAWPLYVVGMGSGGYNGSDCEKIVNNLWKIIDKSVDR